MILCVHVHVHLQQVDLQGMYNNGHTYYMYMFRPKNKVSSFLSLRVTSDMRRHFFLPMKWNSGALCFKWLFSHVWSLLDTIHYVWEIWSGSSNRVYQKQILKVRVPAPIFKPTFNQKGDFFLGDLRSGLKRF